MKVLHVITDMHNDVAATNAALLAMALRRKGHDQSAFFPPGFARAREAEKDGVRLLPNIFVPGFFLLRAHRWKKIIEKESPDIIHIWSPQARLPRGTQKRVIWHNHYEPPHPRRIQGKHVGSTLDLASRLEENEPRVIPAAVESPTTPPIDRVTLATPREAKVILCFSPLQPSKGLENLIASLRTLPEAVLWLAGEGILRRELENEAERKGVMARVRFIGARTDSVALLRAADACVLPGPRDSFASPAIEAWAAGTPVVAVESLGSSALLENETSGLLVKQSDIPALSVALRRAVNDETLRRRLIAQGYASYVKSHAPEAVAQQWLALYQVLLKDAAQ